ncbi:MAG: hypothetical protein UF228_05270, partial [Lachnospiraceae bacterium]|nr:hypothetical protein [Lachnospiraceae bacterium]
EIDKTIVSKRIELDPKLIKKSRDFLREYFNVMDVPADEDGLIAYVITSFTEQRAAYEELIVSKYNMHNYPEKSVVEEGIKMIDSLMAQKKDNTALLQKLVDITDDLLDLQEDMSDILSFFKNQVQIFDSARDMLYRLAKEKDYLQVEDSMMRDLHTAQSIIEMQKPYKRINELPTLMQNIENAYKELLDAKREDVYAEIQSAMAEIHQTAGVDQKDIVKKADDALQAKKNAVSETDNLTSLDAMKIQIQNIKQQYLKALIVVVDPVDTKKIATTNRSNICFSSKLESEKDVDEYVAAIKDKLMGMLEENDVVHII